MVEGKKRWWRPDSEPWTLKLERKVRCARHYKGTWGGLGD